jgi:carboxypeptidase Q
MSIGGNVTAEALVVTSWDDLKSKADQVPGKIVVYAIPWIDYDTSGDYRHNGAAEAAKYGAVAALVRSITPFSMETPHTGFMQYQDGVPKIPAAAITVEDSEMFLRMHKRGQKIVLNLDMENWFIPG